MTQITEIRKKELVENFKREKNVDKRLKIALLYNKLLIDNLKDIEFDISNGVPNYEVFVNMKGYEGIYQISNFGKVKSVERFFIKKRGRSDKYMAVYCDEIIRSIRIKTRGYLGISLWINESVKHVLIHRLVALHFIKNPLNYPQVLHNDDNTSNAKWDNLRWGTQSQNIQECADKLRGFRGSKNGNSKLKEHQIPEIRKLITEGVKLAKIGRMFGVSDVPIKAIKIGRTWSHIK